MTIPAMLLAATVAVDFNTEIGRIRPELHSSGFGPLICSCPKERIDDIKSMGFKAARTHDWALLNANQRVCDYFHMFPLMHLDAKDPKNYVFGPTDYLLKRTREEAGLDIFFRLGTSIEHSGNVHFNALVPDDFDKVAEIFAATVRHYNKGWANGYEWGIKYWEIWNEPDGTDNMWCLPADKGGNDDAKMRDLFVKFFVTVLKRLKSEFPDIKVGGPALCSWSINMKYLSAILDGCKKAGVAPDFISWHHYTNNPDWVMLAIDSKRKLCDDYGFKDCELIINEWHYMGAGFKELRSNDPAVRRRVWEGPNGHNEIDSSCFNLTLLSKFQFSKLDQSYYYGCRHTGAWGFMDENRGKYKVYYGLKMFGDFVKRHQAICEAKADSGLTVIAAKSDKDIYKKGIIVTDYRAGTTEIIVDVKGVPSWHVPRVFLHDHTHDMEPLPLRFIDGKLTLKKPDTNSAAFLILF